MHIRATRGGRGDLPWPFLKINKSALILENKAVILPITGLNFSFKI